MSLKPGRLDQVLTSVYLYNEYQGFTQLDHLLQAFREKFPAEESMISAISRHAADERKHFLMFRNYFEKRGEIPLRVGPEYGYVDRLIRLLLGCSTEDLNPARLLESPKGWSQLFRAILLTESRGLRQIQWLLRRKRILKNDELTRIFRVIEKDEPFHFQPYREWLVRHGEPLPNRRERLADLWIHLSLVLIRIPLLYLKFWQPRTQAPSCRIAS